MDTIFRIALKNASTMTSKMNAPEIYLLICDFENVVETMGDTWQVEITFFRLIFA